MVRFLYVISIVGGLLAGPVLAVSLAPPVAGELVLLVAKNAPARSAGITEAGGKVVGPEQAFLGVFAQSDDPDFAARLKSSGAWFVLDGRQIARLCGVSL